MKRWLFLRNVDRRLDSWRRRRRLTVEALEPRHLLSAAGVASPNFNFVHPADVPSSSPVGYTPAQIRAAYGFDQVTLTDAHGAAVAATGAGQTIAIVDAYNDPNIAAEAATFSRQFGLPQFNVPGGPALKVTSQTGSVTALPPNDADWAIEIALDVEWAHAIAPGANILLVEANTGNFPDLLLAVNRAKVQAGVSVISMSWDGSEFPAETNWDSAFLPRRTNPGETFVAASGDEGSPPEWPAVSPNVLSVGGTSLNLNGNAYSSETAWSGSTGGVATFESEPLYQSRVQSTGLRANPDVAFNSDPNTGMAVYIAAQAGSPAGWIQIGGTSGAAPQWAALLVIANQGRALKALAPLNGAQSALYNLPATDFHDITTGNNGGYGAGPGYDGVTGLGSPRANLVIQHMVGGVPLGAAAPVSGNTGIVVPAIAIQGGGRLTSAIVVATPGDSGEAIQAVADSRSVPNQPTDAWPLRAVAMTPINSTLNLHVLRERRTQRVGQFGAEAEMQMFPPAFGVFESAGHRADFAIE
jgi:subtilase family serine protease